MWLRVHGSRLGIWKRKRFEEEDAGFRVSPLLCQCSEAFQSFLQASFSWAAGKRSKVPWGAFSLRDLSPEGFPGQEGPLFSSSISEAFVILQTGASRLSLLSHKPPLLLHRSLDQSRGESWVWQPQEDAQTVTSLLRRLDDTSLSLPRNLAQFTPPY